MDRLVVVTGIALAAAIVVVDACNPPSSGTTGTDGGSDGGGGPGPDASGDAASQGAGPFLYGAGDGKIYAYHIAANGQPSPLPGAAATTKTSDSMPRSLAALPNGKTLYAASFQSPVIEQFAIDPATGALTHVDNAGAGGNFSVTGAQLTKLAIHPSGKVLYASDEGNSQLVALSVDATTGALSPLGTASVAFGPQVVAVEPTGAYLYVSTRASTFTRFPLDAAGALGQPTSIDLPPECTAVGFAPGARAVLACGNGAAFVDGGAIGGGVLVIADNNGAPTYLGGWPVEPNGTTADGGANYLAWSIAVVPNGKFAYAGDQFGLGTFAIDQNTFVPTRIVYNPSKVVALSIDASGSHLYAACFDGVGSAIDKLCSYNIDSNTGALTPNDAVSGGVPFFEGSAYDFTIVP